MRRLAEPAIAQQLMPTHRQPLLPPLPPSRVEGGGSPAAVVACSAGPFHLPLAHVGRPGRMGTLRLLARS